MFLVKNRRKKEKYKGAKRQVATKNNYKKDNVIVHSVSSNIFNMRKQKNNKTIN